MTSHLYEGYLQANLAVVGVNDCGIIVKYNEL